MRILSKGFKLGRANCQSGEYYEIPERKAHVVEFGWAVEVPSDDQHPFTTLTMADFDTGAPPVDPRPPAEHVVLSVDDMVVVQASDILGT